MMDKSRFEAGIFMSICPTFSIVVGKPIAGDSFKKEKTMKFEIETITPEIAKQMLGENSNFRSTTTRRVQLYADMMKSGDWQLNGESLKFNSEGKLIDGQHRLLACILAETSFQTAVIRGCNEIENLDSGQSRSLSQLLKYRGIKYPKVLAACLVFLTNYEDNKTLASKYSANRNRCLRYFNENPKIIDSISITQRTQTLFSHQALWGALHYLFWQIVNEEKSTVFIKDLIEGANLQNDNPIYLLRERLFKNRNSQAKLPVTVIGGLAIKAWNGWINNQPIGTLKFDYFKEKYPQIQGIEIESELTWKKNA